MEENIEVVENKTNTGVAEKQNEEPKKEKKGSGKAALVLGIIGTTLGVLSLSIILFGGLIRGVVMHKVRTFDGNKMTITQQQDKKANKINMIKQKLNNQNGCCR